MASRDLKPFHPHAMTSHGSVNLQPHDVTHHVLQDRDVINHHDIVNDARVA